MLAGKVREKGNKTKHLPTVLGKKKKKVDAFWNKKEKAQGGKENRQQKKRSIGRGAASGSVG